jgi:predicted hotdog family 3-hydroxylacyl-ACP dehydratase
MPFPPLAELIPHRGTSILIDHVKQWDDAHIVCVAEIRAGHFYERDGRVPATVTLELMAQTVAAYVGLTQHERGLPPRAGYIVAARRFELRADSLDFGAALEVGATVGWGEPRAATFDCWVEDGHRRLAQTTLTVYQPDSSEP